MTENVPSKVIEAGVENWFSTLSDMDRVKLNRYLDKADSSSTFSFFMSLIKAVIADENYRFGITLCVATNNYEFDAYQRFLINEEFIEVLFNRELYEDVKNVCEINFKIFPMIKDIILEENGGKYPNRLNFRNKYIDVIVGIDAQYERGYEMLDTYCEMGILDKEDLEFRRNSLKVHRLQRTFDGVYTYRPKE